MCSAALAMVVILWAEAGFRLRSLRMVDSSAGDSVHENSDLRVPGASSGPEPVADMRPLPATSSASAPAPSVPPRSLLLTSSPEAGALTGRQTTATARCPATSRICQQPAQRHESPPFADSARGASHFLRLAPSPSLWRKRPMA